MNNSTAGLRLAQGLSNTKTYQTLGCYIELQNNPNTGLLHLTQELGNKKKLLKHWKNNPPKMYNIKNNIYLPYLKKLKMRWMGMLTARINNGFDELCDVLVY